MVCKYRTGSKKVLQTKNRFWRIEKRFFMVFTRFLSAQHHPTFHSEPLCIAKGLLLKTIQAPFAMQRKPEWNVKTLPLKSKGGFFHSIFLHTPP